MEIIQYGHGNARHVLIQPVDEHDPELIETESEKVRGMTKTEFSLLAVRVKDWNRELSPWKAQPVFGKEEFGDGAEVLLKQILTLCGDLSKTYFIGGYSMAGLFALWSIYRTDVFKGAAAASPSVWFPGFTDYMRGRKPGADMVYLSLGDREEKVRNPVLSTVGDRIREAGAILDEQGVMRELEWNDGNHFKEPEYRTAKAFAWLLNRVSGKEG